MGRASGTSKVLRADASLPLPGQDNRAWREVPAVVLSSLFCKNRIYASLADLILVLEHGELVERGTHAELVARGDRYWGLLDADARQKEETPLPDRRWELTV